MTWPAFPTFLESVPNLISDLISRISRYSLHLKANHTSPFLSSYAVCIAVSSQSLVMTGMLFPFHQSHCPSFAAGPIFREPGDTLQRASRKVASEVFPPLFSDHCCRQLQIPEPFKDRDQMRWGVIDYSSGESLKKKRRMSLWSLATQMTDGSFPGVTLCDTTFRGLLNNFVLRIGKPEFQEIKNAFIWKEPVNEKEPLLEVLLEVFCPFWWQTHPAKVLTFC